MATVVGKTSTKIDELLADLIVGATIVDGNLLLTQRDGGVVNVGGVGGSSSVMRIFYTSGAWPTRPVGALCVEWVGPTQPSAMTTKDTWVNTS
jgi:hypothetical protein